MVNSFKFCLQTSRMLVLVSGLVWRYSRQRLMNWTAAGSEPTTPYSDTGGGWLGISAATWHREMDLIKHKPVVIIIVTVREEE